MAFQIGQYRYTGRNCVTNTPYRVDYETVSATASGTESESSFKDVVIIPNNGFTKGADYYLYLAIPQDMNYNLEFNIKLIKKENNANLVYQFLRNVSVNRGGTGENVYTVALYEKEDGSVAAMVPLDYEAGTVSIKDALYHDPTDSNKDGYTYYLGTGTTTYTPTNKVNSLSVIAAWRQDIGTNYGVFEIVFRPVEDGFTGLLLEMVRTPEDYDIQRTTSAGTIEYGRIVDIEKLKITLYKLNNLVQYMNKDSELSRIGVWSHSGLIMAINGEDIRIGPSGYYEEDVVPITSLGIVAPNNDYYNNFTVDYTYFVDTEEE